MWLVWHVLLACGIWHLAHGTWYCLVLNGTQKALNSLAHSPAGLSRTGAGDTRTETLAHPFVAWPYANRKWCVGQLVPYLHLINIGAGLVKPDNGQSIMDTGHGTAWTAEQMAKRQRRTVVTMASSMSPHSRSIPFPLQYKTVCNKWHILFICLFVTLCPSCLHYFTSCSFPYSSSSCCCRVPFPL